MTHYTLADLEMADRHIVEGGQRITRLEEMVASLELKGLSTSEGKKLLALFNETQAEYRDHRDAIATAIERANLVPPFRRH